MSDFEHPLHIVFGDRGFALSIDEDHQSTLRLHADTLAAASHGVLRALALAQSNQRCDMTAPELSNAIVGCEALAALAAAMRERLDSLTVEGDAS